jgi:hypothetical protein
LKEKFFYRAVIKIETVFIGDYHETESQSLLLFYCELDGKNGARGRCSKVKAKGIENCLQFVHFAKFLFEFFSATIKVA